MAHNHQPATRCCLAEANHCQMMGAAGFEPARCFPVVEGYVLTCCYTSFISVSIPPRTHERLIHLRKWLGLVVRCHRNAPVDSL